MSRASLVRASRVASRALRSAATPRAALRPLSVPSHSILRQVSSSRNLSQSAPLRKGIMPDAESPSSAKEPVPSPEPTYGVVELSEPEYHEIADEYLEGVLTQFEALQDTREDIDIEFSVCSPRPCLQANLIANMFLILHSPAS